MAPQTSVCRSETVLEHARDVGDAPALYYVLSAGRTGTVFLEKLIHRYCPDVTAEHEPSPSRYLLMLGNMRNDTGALSGVTQRFARWHQAKRHRTHRKYIEINPFLCPVTDLLPHPDRPLRILHIVREPGSWAQSLSTFKASSRYRNVVDYVPFAKPYPAPRPDGWRQMSAFEKNLHRWNWCNSRIAALAAQAELYALVRSEDVFSGDAEVRDVALAQMVDTLDLRLPEDLPPDAFQTRVNPAPEGVDLRDPAKERAICGAMAAAFGYEL